MYLHAGVTKIHGNDIDNSILNYQGSVTFTNIKHQNTLLIWDIR